MSTARWNLKEGSLRQTAEPRNTNLTLGETKFVIEEGLTVSGLHALGDNLQFQRLQLRRESGVGNRLGDP
ncbi:hypothetical protein [Ectothiorhodospira marina]|uniref:hypothetical protein n=1 Tax=Ectothiorhodospira marina TaxID=1396821 RepID=UPI000B7E790B|nr:hypothetical protein [Ectothiorhodospira marina]